MNCIYGNYPGVFLTWGRYLLLIYVVKYFDTSNCIENKVSYFMPLYVLQQVVIVILVSVN